MQTLDHTVSAAEIRQNQVGRPQTRLASSRVSSVDLLRGLVMVLMTIDHTRDFVHAAAMSFPPEDLSRTTAAFFFTRWITHFCAPAFMFCAGLGAWFRLERGGSRADLSRFLVTRGLWLIVLEFTVVNVGFFFNFEYRLLFLLVFWALGMSMIALAGLIHLPYRALLAISLGMIALHNLTDAIPPATSGAFGWLWQVLHQPGLIAAGPPAIVVAYPLIPWIAVMAAGFCFGRIYRLPAERRRLVLIGLGVALTVAFVVIRAANIYGDPRPWTIQNRSGFTLLSFLNCTNYPASLSFLLMTLGPAIVFLGLVDRVQPRDRNLLITFGRTPLLYFVLHIPLIHVVAIALTWLRYGSAPFLFLPPPTLGTPRDVFPPDYGWSLWMVYVVTAAVVMILYPVVLWFARLRARRRDWWLSYL